MPTPCESCPMRFAVTRFSATIRASRGSLPPAVTMASIARVSGSFWNTGAFMSFRLDAAALDHLRPAVDFVLHESAEFFGRARDHVEPDLVHALAYVGRAQCPHRGVIQLRHH